MQQSSQDNVYFSDDDEKNNTFNQEIQKSKLSLYNQKSDSLEQELQYQVSSGQFTLQDIKKTKLGHHRKWTVEEDKLLMQLYDENPKSWTLISQKIRNRTPVACFLRFKTKSKSKKGRERITWTSQQDKLLLQLYVKHPQQWSIIYKYFPRRNKMTCYNRHRFLNNLHIPPYQRQWTQKQDNLLLKLYQKYPSNWKAIAKNFRNCNESNCYSRYRKLKNIKQSASWTIQQDNLLIQLTKSKRPEWQKIYNRFQKKRTMNAIKLRYYYLKGQGNKMKQWNQNQKQKLNNLYNKYQGNWPQIQKHFPQYTISQCILQYFSDKAQPEEVEITKKKLRSAKSMNNTKKVNFSNETVYLSDEQNINDVYQNYSGIEQLKEVERVSQTKIIIFSEAFRLTLQNMKNEISSIVGYILPLIQRHEKIKKQHY